MLGIQTPPYLLRLPEELLDTIYELVVRGDKHIVIDTTIRIYRLEGRELPDMSIIFVCKKLYATALAALFRANNFYLRSMADG